MLNEMKFMWSVFLFSSCAMYVCYDWILTTLYFQILFTFNFYPSMAIHIISFQHLTYGSAINKFPPSPNRPSSFILSIYHTFIAYSIFVPFLSKKLSPFHLSQSETSFNPLLFFASYNQLSHAKWSSWLKTFSIHAIWGHFKASGSSLFILSPFLASFMPYQIISSSLKFFWLIASSTASGDSESLLGPTGYGPTSHTRQVSSGRPSSWSWIQVWILWNLGANQGSIFHWSRDHRLHHKFSDTDLDPHTISKGFFYSHVGWLLVKKSPKLVE